MSEDEIETMATRAYYGGVSNGAGGGAEVGDLQVSDRLAVMRGMAQRVERDTRLYALQARAGGASWAEVGVALGVSRQAAQQRFGA